MSYSIEFARKAHDDLEFWKNTGSKTILNRIKTLLKSTQQSPFQGSGKPEPLKNQLSGYWSRRINKEHRIIYRVTGDTIHITALRFHYR